MDGISVTKSVDLEIGRLCQEIWLGPMKSQDFLKSRRVSQRNAVEEGAEEIQSVRRTHPVAGFEAGGRWPPMK